MKTIYFILFSFGLFLASCSSTRNVHYGDDVYYSPDSRPAASGEYVAVYNEDERNSYDYREDYEIRRGIRNPVYRSNFSLSLGMGFGSPFYMGGLYSPFYSPFGGMYSSFYYGSPYSAFYNPFYSPFYYSSFYSPFYDPFYSPYYGMGHMYSPIYGYGGYGYGGYYGAPYISNGPRTTNLRPYATSGIRSISTPNNSGTIRKSAPIRTVRNVEGTTTPENGRRRSFIGRLFSNEESAPSRVSRSDGNSRYVNPSNTGTRSNVRTFDNQPSTPARTETRTVAPRTFNNSNSSPSRMSSPSVSSPRTSSPSPSRAPVRRR